MEFNPRRDSRARRGFGRGSGGHRFGDHGFGGHGFGGHGFGPGNPAGPPGFVAGGFRAGDHDEFLSHHEGHGDHHDAHHDHERRRMRGGFRPPFPPGFGPGFGRRRDHGHSRGRRGNVRVAILALLVERPMHGYEMIQELDQRTGGVWRPSPGSVYPTLQLLEDEGKIVAEETGGRKAYSLTEAGQEEATAAAANAPWAEFSEETVSSGHDTREAVTGIMMALRQIGFERNQEQWQRAVDVLNETKRKLYAILADSE